MSLSPDCELGDYVVAPSIAGKAYNGSMSADLRQKDLVNQAEEEFGLLEDISDLEASERAVSIKPTVELEVAEEVMNALTNGELQYDVWLGFADGTTTKIGSLEWEIKVSYLDQLVKDGVLQTATTEEVWDDDNYSSIAIYRIEINSLKQDQLQMEINRLAELAGKSDVVQLVEGEVGFNSKTGLISFNDKSFTISDNYSRRLLEYMFDAEVGDAIEASDLYKAVFSEELLVPNDGVQAKEGRNVQVKNLRNKKQHINDRVKAEFNTTDDLIFSQGYYRRDY